MRCAALVFATPPEGSGDAIRHRVVEGADDQLIASIGDKSATVRVLSRDEQIDVTSVTWACTQLGNAPWWAAFAGGLLMLRRRR